MKEGMKTDPPPPEPKATFWVPFLITAVVSGVWMLLLSVF